MIDRAKQVIRMNVIALGAIVTAICGRFAGGGAESEGGHTFITHGQGLLDPMLDLIVVLALYLLWVERKVFAGLVNRD